MKRKIVDFVDCLDFVEVSGSISFANCGSSAKTFRLYDVADGRE